MRRCVSVINLRAAFVSKKRLAVTFFPSTTAMRCVVMGPGSPSVVGDVSWLFERCLPTNSAGVFVPVVREAFPLVRSSMPKSIQRQVTSAMWDGRVSRSAGTLSTLRTLHQPQATGDRNERHGTRVATGCMPFLRRDSLPPCRSSRQSKFPRSSSNGNSATFGMASSGGGSC